MSSRCFWKMLRSISEKYEFNSLKKKRKTGYCIP
jgi:hypothetical protein